MLSGMSVRLKSGALNLWRLFNSIPSTSALTIAPSMPETAHSASSSSVFTSGVERKSHSPVNTGKKMALSEGTVQ